MTAPMVVERSEIALRPGRRLGAMAAVGAARLLATQSPARIRRVLGRLGEGARPADYASALAARQAVMAVSLTCREERGCVPRSIATTLLCRMTGSVPTWCVGVRTVAPFAAHAWVEADGVIVGESVPPGYLRALLAVGPGTEPW
ncbi:Transglutaminase-like superfamily [Frankia torreyi]|uniref:Transglutaminase-like superfamily n=2 Tax=Frankiaceae TaxID=74712 RepID=A0A0D8BIK0_9ACTN|nr:MULTISPECIES: lasso peptide biosynthesis B2 protein [unclassified Frankia]KJE23895.1 Transglutaminase-like superfamily [Frankia torreyi]KQC39963.1 polyketide beta-ketoacyl synthase [Frankia sp. ACN1ag]KQM05804.1 Transglutaminase-like superfamily [Frankia sp. CpI1-P]